MKPSSAGLRVIVRAACLAERALDFAAFRSRARIIPQNRVADGIALRVQQHEAVHLAGEADVLRWHQPDRPAVCSQLAKRFDRSVHPIVRTLLAPAGMLMEQRIIARCFRDDRAAPVKKQHLYRACA